MYLFVCLFVLLSCGIANDCKIICFSTLAICLFEMNVHVMFCYFVVDVFLTVATVYGLASFVIVVVVVSVVLELILR